MKRYSFLFCFHLAEDEQRELDELEGGNGPEGDDTGNEFEGGNDTENDDSVNTGNGNIIGY